MNPPRSYGWPAGDGQGNLLAMLPDVTDAIISRTITNARMMEAGREYWRSGRVGRFEGGTDGAVVSASVKGTARAPYLVELRFRQNASVTTSCTCPVAIGCKHDAAVLFALQAAKTGTRYDASDVNPGRKRITVDHAAPRQTVEPLPAALVQWAAAIKPLTERHGTELYPATRAILYIVKVQVLYGTARLSKKRPLASMTPPGCALRLTIEPVDVTLDVGGRPTGSGTKVYAGSLYPGYGSPAYMSAEDRLIGRRLQQRLGDTDHEGCLCGAGGADLLERIIATGRSRWENPRGPVLQQGEQRSAPLGWVHDELGRTRLSVAGIVPSSVVTLVAPPVVIDTIGGTVAPLDLAVATELPAKSVMQVAVTPTTAQMALHESQRLVMQQCVRDEIARVGLMRAQIMVLTALTRLRQVCCDPRLLPNHGAKPPSSAKLERLLELLG